MLKAIPHRLGGTDVLPSRQAGLCGVAFKLAS